MYFIALVAPDLINHDVLKWKQFMKERFDCLVALRSPAHITLIPPFWMEGSLENRLEDALKKFSKQQLSFALELANFGAFKPRVIYVDVVPNEILKDFHSRLQVFLTGTRLFPISKEDHPYHPHVTIATRDLHKKSFQEAWTIFKEKEYKASWKADNISLLKHNQKNWEVIFTSRLAGKGTE